MDDGCSMRAERATSATPSRGGMRNQKAIARANGAFWHARVGWVRSPAFLSILLGQGRYMYECWLGDWGGTASGSWCLGGWERDGHMLMVDVQRQRLSHLHTRDSDLRIEHDQADGGAEKDEVGFELGHGSREEELHVGPGRWGLADLQVVL